MNARGGLEYNFRKQRKRHIFLCFYACNKQTDEGENKANKCLKF